MRAARIRREHGRTGARRRWVHAAVLAVLPFSGPAVAQDAVPSPSEFLGFPIGADSLLADWAQIGSYFSTLAASSPAVRLDTIGRSTLGKPLLLATVTAPRHHGRLDAIKQAQALLADPRRLTPALEDSLVRETPALVFVANNIHSTEIASSLFSMLLAHRLATEPGLQPLLEQLVVLIAPSVNPDGLDTVVAWYRQHRGTAYEAGPLPWLYHPYVGHDNNRDWYMMTQAETRAIARVLYQEWFPLVVWDVHQMGGRGARLFVPPFADPVNPNLDPILVEATNLVGAAMATALYDAGKTGVEHQRGFDMWWHGGLRTVPARHNMIGILSEAASARLGSPVYLPAESLRTQDRGVNHPGDWEGGWWRIGDIIEYELLAADGLLRLVAAQRETFLRRFVTLGRRQVTLGQTGRPFAYLIPPDQRDRHAAALLANALIRAGIEIARAEEPFEADGRSYAAGTLIIPMAQPFRAHVKDLLEPQRYPDRRQYPDGPPQAPYDMAGWSLAMQMGVHAPAVQEPFRYVGSRLDRATAPAGRVHGQGPQRVLANRAATESRTIVEALRSGALAWVLRAEAKTNGDGAALAPGAVVLEHADPALLDSLVRDHTARFGFDAWASEELTPPPDPITRVPRIGLYKPWTANMDEGWTRWVLEQYGIPYITVTDSTIRAGQLGRVLDVLILPDETEERIMHGRAATDMPPPFAGGIGEEGARHVAEFVQRGGVLVALDGASELAISSLGLPVRSLLPSRQRPDSRSPFYAPGSILGVALQRGTVLTSGMDDSVAVVYRNSVVLEADPPARVVGQYAEAPLRSGYALSPEWLTGKAALVDVAVGRGQAILFGFRPQHRGQSHGTFKLLFNAVLLSAQR